MDNRFFNNVRRRFPKNIFLQLSDLNGMIRLSYVAQFLAMEKFMFLFRGGNFRSLSPELMQHHMQEWLDWMDSLKAKNILAGSEPLQPTGVVVSGKNKVVTNGPFIEKDEMVGGYTIMLANNIEDALAISSGCPIFEMDGKLEIRPLRPFMR